jgi:hypothetical protein
LGRSSPAGFVNWRSSSLACAFGRQSIRLEPKVAGVGDDLIWTHFASFADDGVEMLVGLLIYRQSGVSTDTYQR